MKGIRFLKPLHFFLFFLIVPFTIRAQYEEAFKHPYPQRYVAIDSINFEQVGFMNGPDSVNAAMQKLYAKAKEKDDPKAVLIADLYLLQYQAQLNPKLITDRQFDSIAGILTERARRLSLPALEATVYVQTAFYYYTEGQYIKGHIAHLKGYDLYQTMGQDEFPKKAYSISSIGMSYYYFGDYVNAIRYGREAAGLRVFHSEIFVPMYNYNMLGMAFLKLNIYDSARKYFNLTYEIANIEQARRYGWNGIALGNIGVAWMLQDNYDKAIPYLKRGIDSTAARGIWDNTCVFMSRLATLYERLGRWEDAGAMIPGARAATYRGGSEEGYILLYKMMSDYYHHKGDDRQAFIFRDSAAYWQDSVDRRFDQMKETRAELGHAEIKYRLSQQKFQNDLRTQHIVRNNLLAFIVLATIVALIIVRRRQQRLRAKSFQAEQALLKAQVELKRFADDIHEKNAMIEALESYQRTHEAVANTAGHVGLLEKLRQSVIITDEGWNNFRQTFEAAYPGYIYEIKSKHPDLTPAEHRLMVLDKLGLSTREMAAMLGIAPQTVRATRSRMQKKING